MSLSYRRVENLDERSVDWGLVTSRLEEYGRTRKLIRERWRKVLKGQLLESDDVDEVSLGIENFRLTVFKRVYFNF